MINLRQHTHSPRDAGKLTGQKKNSFEQGTLLALFCILYIDNGAFTFEDRDQLTRGLNLIYQHFTRFGLEMHVGKGEKASKTECVFFPHQDFSETFLFLVGGLSFCLKILAEERRHIRYWKLYFPFLHAFRVQTL